MPGAWALSNPSAEKQRKTKWSSINYESFTIRETMQRVGTQPRFTRNNYENCGGCLYDGQRSLCQPRFSFPTGRERANNRNDRIFVSEASGVPNGSSASSYRISEAGGLAVISATVPTEQQAACWLTLARDEHFAYTANAGSGSISGFSVAPDGSLHLLAPNGVTVVTGVGSHPVDLAASRDGRFLFALANGNGTLASFHVTSRGPLQSLGFASGIPASAAGLAAR